MKHAPPVCIGVPVFNGDAYIAGALQSLLAQSHGDLEVLVSDNASTDGTEEICRGVAAHDARVRYVRNASNIGLLANFRRTLALSSSEYFMWTAADDTRPPNAVADLLSALRADDSATLAYGVTLFRVVGRSDLIPSANELKMRGLGAGARVRVFTQHLIHNAVFYGLYRRIAAQRGTLGNHYGNDYLFCLTMSLGGPFAYTPAPVLVHRYEASANEPIANVRYGPMYGRIPATLKTLVRAKAMRRNKCWTVFVMGCYYLARYPATGLSARIAGVAAHLWYFGRRYRLYLTREAIHLLLNPFFWLAALPLRVGRKLARLLVGPRAGRWIVQ